MSREGYNELQLDLYISTISSYLFGSLYAFADFFMFHIGMPSSSIYIEEPLTFGYYSFKPLFDLLGGAKVFPPGYYQDFYDYKGFITTNLFTYHRGIIQDFGLFGSFIFTFFAGFFVHLSYYVMLTFKRPFFSISFFIIFCVFSGMSFIMSIFTARNIIMVLIGLYIILFLNSVFLRITNKRGF